MFEEDFKTLLGEKMQQIGKTVDEIEKETEKRKAKAKKKPSRPSEYRYSGLEERHKVLYPEGINLEDFEEIGRKFVRILHRTLPNFS